LGNSKMVARVFFLLREVKRLGSEVEALEDEVTANRLEIAKLQVKAGLVGAATGALGTISAFLLA